MRTFVQPALAIGSVVHLHRRPRRGRILSRRIRNSILVHPYAFYKVDVNEPQCVYGFLREELVGP